ncbi:rhodanese-like domain-containing protein [Streptomyces sp. NPDC097619]|uniref:rhodanese-like domain-containing protein n=1 Tax=Streptomyces sp. NPDC097619 TaxID=3157228 RepID=UPI00332A22A7
MSPSALPAPELAADQARARLHEFEVIDVRTPAEFASGHLPGARNVPLDRLAPALDGLRASGTDLLVVCASGARSAQAARTLAGHGLNARSLAGGTGAWRRSGGELHHPGGSAPARTVWAMERQVRFAAGGLVLLGLAASLLHPAFLLLSAGVAAGLVFSAVTDTCGMAAVLARFPHNRR